MRPKKATKKKITAASTLLHEPQSVVMRDPGAIGEPNEKINLHLIWRKYRLTSVTMAPSRNISVSRLI